jgi:hypothetical protein
MRKIIIFLLFPLAFEVLFIFASGAKYIDLQSLSFRESIMIVFGNYIIFSSPHYIAVIISLISRLSTNSILEQLKIANTVLFIFGFFVLSLSWMNYRDLALVWIFYLPIALLFVIGTWLVCFIEKRRAKKKMK